MTSKFNRLVYEATARWGSTSYKFQTLATTRQSATRNITMQMIRKMGWVTPIETRVHYKEIVVGEITCVKFKPHTNQLELGV